MFSQTVTDFYPAIKAFGQGKPVSQVMMRVYRAPDAWARKLRLCLSFSIGWLIRRNLGLQPRNSGAARLASRAALKSLRTCWRVHLQSGSKHRLHDIHRGLYKP